MTEDGFDDRLAAGVLDAAVAARVQRLLFLGSSSADVVQIAGKGKRGASQAAADVKYCIAPLRSAQLD